MRILRRQEFLLLPVGTLYARGKPWAFDNLQIKGETICFLCSNGTTWLDCA